MGLRGPHFPASRGATEKLGDAARAENWRNPEGANSLGRLSASFLSQPLMGMLLRSATDICPKSSRVTCVGFSTVS
jgi:hypothetical protein